MAIRKTTKNIYHGSPDQHGKIAFEIRTDKPATTEEKEGLKAFRTLRASRGETETEARRKGWKAFLQMRKMAIANGAADMSLEEINKEISAVRNG